MNIRIIPFERLIEQDKNARGVFAKKWEICVECNSLEEAKKLKETLAQPEQEPVAWELRAGKTDRVLIEITNNPQRAHDWKASLEEVVPLYTTPPQRKPLTDEECINQMLNSGFERNSLGWSFTYGRLDYHLLKFARAIEAAHGIKGE